jgi:hypothetical protein
MVLLTNTVPQACVPKGVKGIQATEISCLPFLLGHAGRRTSHARATSPVFVSASRAHLSKSAYIWSSDAQTDSRRRGRGKSSAMHGKTHYDVVMLWE